MKVYLCKTCVCSTVPFLLSPKHLENSDQYIVCTAFCYSPYFCVIWLGMCGCVSIGENQICPILKDNDRVNLCKMCLFYTTFLRSLKHLENSYQCIICLAFYYSPYFCVIWLGMCGCVSVGAFVPSEPHTTQHHTEHCAACFVRIQTI